MLARGRTSTFYIVGEGTNWNSGNIGTSAIGMGADVIVLSANAISTTAIEVSAAVASTAATGPRNLTVTPSGGATLTLANGINIAAGMTASSNDLLSQGASAVVRVKLAAGKMFIPSVSGSNLIVANATFTVAPAGLTVVGTPRWAGADTVEMVVSVGPFAALGPATVTATFNDGTESETAALGEVLVTLPAPLTAGTPESGSIILARDAALFTLDVAVASAVTFVVQPGTGATLVPRIRVYAANNNTALRDAVGTSNTTATSTTVTLPAGTSTISVVDANNGGAVTGFDFTINATVLGAAEVEPNPIGTPTPLTLGTTPIFGSISPAADKDFYSFTATGGTYVFETRSSGGTTFDSRIFVCLVGASSCAYGTAGTNNSGQDDDAGPSSYSAFAINLAAGNYVIGVEALSASTTGDYQLVARQVTPVAESGAAHNNAATAQTVAIGNVVTAVLSASSEQDWYKFDVTTVPATITIATSYPATADNVDTQIWFCTQAQSGTCTYSSGNTTSDDDGSDKNYSSLTTTITVAGTYFIGVRTFNGSSTGGNYLLRVTQD